MLAHAVRGVPTLVWALLIALVPLLLRTFDMIGDAPLGMHDPDSWLRLTLVRDWLSGGGWYDHSYHSNAPLTAMQSPWTRPLDIVIGFFTTLQFGGSELTDKLVRTAYFLPLFWMTLLVLALLTIMRRITRMPHALLLVGVLFVTAPINYNYYAPGNADHHAPLAALFAWVVALLLNHDARRGNGLVVIGILLALMLWISPESLLLIAIIYGWLGLQWLGGASLKPLLRVATTTALASAVAVMIERPFAEWTTHIYDSISIAQVMPLALVALAAFLLSRITSFFWLWRALAASALLGAMGAALYFIDPLFFHGPMASVDAYIHTEFLPRIVEARHAWSEPTLEFVGLLLQPLFALYVAFRCLSQRQGILPPAASACLLYLLVATGALYLVQQRWAYYFFPLVPLVLAPYLAAWLNPQHSAVSSYWPASRLRRLTDKQIMAKRLPLLLVVLATPALLLIISGLSSDHTAVNAMAACHKEVRRLAQNDELTKLGNGKSLTIFAPTDLGPEILFFTPHHVIASNYHREGSGIRTVWTAQASKKPGPLHKALIQRKADLLIICPDTAVDDDAFMLRLRTGEAKEPWLLPAKIKAKGTPTAKPGIFLVKGNAR